MSQVQRSPTPDHATATHDAAAEHTADELRYSAAQAAIAFGIPRIAPIVRSRAAPQAVTHEAAAGSAADVEDRTESLTANQRDAAGVFPPHGDQELQELRGRVADSVHGDPVTAALRMPDRELEERSQWGRAQPHTERLIVPVGPARPSLPKSTARPTAVLPHLGRGEAATRTVTLPPDPGLGMPASPGLARPAQIAKWALLGASAALLLLGVGFLGHALTVANLWPGAAGTAAAPRPPAAYRQRLLEQATFALRDGRPEQAVGLLLRYQASEPAGSADRTVEIMLRVLKKDLGTPAR